MAPTDNTNAPSWLSQVPAVEERQRRGLALAASNKVKATTTGFKVRSQTKQKYYTVDLGATKCSCQDFADRQRPCKHVFAVRATMGVAMSVASDTTVAGTPPPARKRRGRPPKNPAEVGPGLVQLSIFDRPVAGTPAPSREGPRKSASDPDAEPPEDAGPAVAPSPSPTKPSAPASGLLVDVNGQWAIRSTSVAQMLRVSPSIPVPTTPTLDTPIFLPSEKAGGPVIANPDAGLTDMVPERPPVRPPGNAGEKMNSRNYAKYNLALETEKPGVMKLLAELCAGIEERPPGMGRPYMALKDMVFAATSKVFHKTSLRKFNADLAEAHSMGYISQKPKYNTLCEYFCLPDITPILMNLITASALPMNGMDNITTPDSTGFSTDSHLRWHAKKHEGVRDIHEWIKVHITSGNITKIVTAVAITGWTGEGTGDSTYFIPLLERTRQYFDVEAVAADKAYLSSTNLEYAVSTELMPYIPFKTNTKTPKLTDGSAWAMIYQFFRYCSKEEFDEFYHQRSGVETAIGMIKGNFGDSLRSLHPVAQVNEALCKVLCHNLTVVHKGAVMLGLDPVMKAKLPPPRPLLSQG